MEDGRRGSSGMCGNGFDWIHHLGDKWLRVVAGFLQ